MNIPRRVHELIADADHTRNNACAFLKCALDQLETIPALARTRADAVMIYAIRFFIK